MNQYIYILMVFIFILCFLATISVYQTKRIKYVVGLGFLIIIFFVFLLLNDHSESLISSLQYLVAFGIFLPQLLARFYIHYQLKSPVEFMHRKMSASSISTGIFFLIVIVFYILVAMQPNRVNYETGERIYTNKDIQYRLSFIFILIFGGLFLYYVAFQRTAFCSNGLLHWGLLWDWSNFQSYKWENEELYKDADARLLTNKDAIIMLTLHSDFKTVGFPAQLQFVFLLTDKERIENVLKQGFSSR